MKPTRVFSILAFAAGLVVTLTLSSILVEAQPGTPTAVPSPLPTSTPAATPSTLGYDQALVTYKEIATEVIKSAERVLDITKWIVAGIFSLIGVAGGAILYISRTAGQARDSAARSAQAAEDSKVQVEKVESRIQDTLAQIQAFQADVEGIRKQLESLRQDLSLAIPRLATLATVDDYAMKLFSADSKISRVARRALIELSKDEDPVVRRECVRVFGAMPDYPECFVDLQDPAIISRLQEMAQKDREHGVQLEAKRTLRKFGVELEGESKA